MRPLMPPLGSAVTGSVNRDKSHQNSYASAETGTEEELLRHPNDGLAVGQRRCQTRLGSEAVYEICELDSRFARVEVVRAPGLRAGQHFKFSRDAVALMEFVTVPLESELAAGASLARPLAVHRHSS